MQKRSSALQFGGILGKLLLILAALFALLLFRGGRSADSSAPADPLAGVRGACKEFIGRSLHDPGSADWGEYWAWGAADNHDGTYSVSAKYRAKNGFGALRLTNTFCVVRRSGPDLQLVRLTQLP